MDSLTKVLLEGLLEADKKKTTAIYGGGFKPPTKGHFDVVKKAAEQNPEIDDLLIYAGSGERNGIGQGESIQIWDLYKKYLPIKTQIVPSKAPIGDILRYAKEHPDEDVLWIIGARENNPEDFADIVYRTRTISKYPNLHLRIIQTAGGVSGTAARKAVKDNNKEQFFHLIPDIEEKEQVWNIVSPIVKESSKKKTERLRKMKEASDPQAGTALPYGSGFAPVNENTIPTIDIIEKCAQLSNHMVEKGYNIKPFPTIEFIDNDIENAENFLGKTAYYDPNEKKIVVYTAGRHPKDIVRSFAHEMIHHMQNLEGRLGDITTTNTTEDSNLEDIEKEAYLNGNISFRNWTDSLNENLTKNSNYLYHWTSYSACKKIIESNKLKSNKSNQFFEYDESRVLPDYKNVVFFTIEDERFADEENSNQCILVVDKSKLSKDYKVISYGDPYEETVVYTNDSSIPILPYLKGVVLMNTLQKSTVKKMVEFLESKGIPYEINDNLEKEVKDKQAKLQTLKKEFINKLK